MTRRAAIGCETGVHPAVAGWRAFAGTATEPTAVETIARSPKSAVYRLRGVSRSGAAIIAKAQSVDGHRLERTIYEDVLPALGVSMGSYHGAIEIREGW